MGKSRIGFDKKDGYAPKKVGSDGPITVKLATDQDFGPEGTFNVDVGVTFDRYVLATFSSEFGGFTSGGASTFIIPPRTSRFEVKSPKLAGTLRSKAGETFLLVFPLLTDGVEVEKNG